MYIFDYVNDRGFFIELAETKPEASNMYYPVCTDFAGDIPSQIGKKSTKKIFDDDDDDIDMVSSRKPAPILDEFLDDIPDVNLDKETQETFDLENVNESSMFKDGEEDEEKFDDDLDNDLEDIDDVEDIADEDD